MNQSFLYEGKAKRIYNAESEELVRMQFKDSLTAGDGAKKGSFMGKGEINTEITAILFEILNKQGFDTHFVKKLSETEILCRKVLIIPIEVVVRNVVAGSFSRRYGIPEGKPLEEPLVELFLKNDELHDPVITNDAALSLGFLSELELSYIKTVALQINNVLSEVFKKINLKLVDFKLEFGRDADGNIILADEITQDTMRLWDVETGERKDKDRFRRDLGKVKETYLEFLFDLQNLVYNFQKTIISRVILTVTLKSGIIDSVGETTRKSLEKLEYKTIKQVYSGKQLILEFASALNKNRMNDISSMIETILSNPLIEKTMIHFSY